MGDNTGLSEDLQHLECHPIWEQQSPCQQQCHGHLYLKVKYSHVTSQALLLLGVLSYGLLLSGVYLLKNTTYPIYVLTITLMHLLYGMTKLDNYIT